MALIIPADVLNSIAHNLEMGMDCWYHIPTGEVLTAPNELKNYDIEDEIWADTFKEVNAKKHESVAFECLDSREEFKIMESFAENEVIDRVVRARLITALSQRKPFSHFKSAINYDGNYLEAWYGYKLQSYIEHVQEELDYYNSKSEKDDEDE